jgi:hypothetical protein
VGLTAACLYMEFFLVVRKGLNFLLKNTGEKSLLDP